VRVRGLADAEAVRALMRALGRAAVAPARVYLVGGATAVIEGWRATTVDFGEGTVAVRLQAVSSFYRYQRFNGVAVASRLFERVFSGRWPRLDAIIAKTNAA